MSTSALITMLLVQLFVTIMTVRFLWKTIYSSRDHTVNKK